MNHTRTAATPHSWNRVFLFAVVFWLLSIFFKWFYPERGALVVGHFITPVLLSLSGIWLYTRGRNMSWEQGILIALTAWYTLTRILNGPHYLETDYGAVCEMAATALVAFPLASLFSPLSREKAFKALAALVVVAVGALAWVAVVMAVLGRLFQAPLSQMVIGVNEVYSNPSRLNILDLHPNFSAAVFSFAMGLMLTLCACVKRKGWWIPAAALGLGLYAAIALTLSRTAMVTVSLELAGFVYLMVRKRLRPGLAKGLVAVLVAVAVLAASILGLYASIDVMDTMADRYAARQTQTLLPEAGAKQEVPDTKPKEKTESQEMLVDRQRLNHSVSSFAGRLTDIYPAIPLVLKDRPATLLIGTRTEDVVKAASRLAGRYIYHWHNSFLQTMMTAGLPALLLALAFSVLLVVKAGRLALSAGTPLAAQALVLPLAGLFLHGMLEDFLFVNPAILNLLFMLFAGFLFLQDERKKA